ncbi:hypothetical protein LCGC14_3082540, partial [marine sediment metagenome]
MRFSTTTLLVRIDLLSITQDQEDD